MPKEKWTDERLDDLNKKVDVGSARVDTNHRELKGEMNERFDKVDERFEKVEAEMNQRFEKVESEMDQRFDKVDVRFDKVEGKMESGMKELRGEINVVNGNLMDIHQLLIKLSFRATLAFGLALIGAVGTVIGIKVF